MRRNLLVALAIVGMLGCTPGSDRALGPMANAPDLATAISTATDDMATSPFVLNDLASPGGANDLAGAKWHYEDTHGLLVNGIAAVNATDIWAIGYLNNGSTMTGAILHSAGDGQWASLQSLSSGPSAIWAAGTNDIWVGGNAGLLMHTVDGITWTPSKYWSSHSTQEIDAIWGTSSSDVYVTTMVTADGTTGLYHSTGNDAWTSVALPSGTHSNLAIWGSSTTDLYAVIGTILHGDGSGKWTPEATGSGASAVWGSGAHDVYVAGGGTILHSAGDGHWLQQLSLGQYNYLHRVWGTSASDVWAIGYMMGTPNYPIVEHSTGNGKWTNMAAPDWLGVARAIGGSTGGHVLVGCDVGIAHLY